MSLKIENVSKKYGNKQVVDNISIELDKPEVFGLLGTNGAGKTTTIRMLLGIIKKDNVPPEAFAYMFENKNFNGKNKE